MPQARRSSGKRSSTGCAHGAEVVVAALILGALLWYVGAASAADEPPSGAGRIIIQDSGAYVDIPVPPELHGPSKLYFYGKDRIEVPGSVAVDVSPYVCDLDELSFEDRESFTAHLSSQHRAILDGSSRPFVVRDGQVHFIGK